MTITVPNRLISAVFISFIALFLFVSISFAQENTDITRTAQTRPAQVRQNVSDRVESKREATAIRVADRREAFREKLSEITDEQKQAALERINNALQTINENKTTRWANALDTLSDILERMNGKVTELEESGVDTDSISEFITTAEGDLETAISAVEEQAANEYIIEIEDETTLRENVQPVVQQFKQDLRTTLSSVISAKQSIQQVARALGSLNKSDENIQ